MEASTSMARCGPYCCRVWRSMDTLGGLYTLCGHAHTPPTSPYASMRGYLRRVYTVCPLSSAWTVDAVRSGHKLLVACGRNESAQVAVQSSERDLHAQAGTRRRAYATSPRKPQRVWVLQRRPAETCDLETETVASGDDLRLLETETITPGVAWRRRRSRPGRILGRQRSRLSTWGMR